MIIVGIDPGISSAIAFLRLDPDSFELFDMPTLELARNGKAKRQVNAYEAARLQAFQFGQSTGLIVGVLAGQRATATKLFPRYAEHFARVKDEGKAEAVLIALYGAQQGGTK